MTQAVSRRNGRWSMESILGAAGARALLTAVGTAGVVASIPPGTLDHWIAASGLGKALPLLAPPLPLTTRLMLAAGAGLVAGLLILAAWRTVPRASAPAQGDPMKDQRPASSGKAKKEPRKGWGIAALFGRKRPRKPAASDALARRKADHHPDAPPRPPLLASRDLPPAPPASTPAAPPPPAAGLPRLDEIVPDSRFDILDDESPDTPHRADEPADQPAYAGPATFAPEPLEADAEEETAEEPPAPEPAAPAPVEAIRAARFEPARALVSDVPADSGSEEAETAAIDAAPESLAGLLARFEHGLSRRMAVIDARSAETQLSERLIFAEPDPAVRSALRALRPVESVAPPPVRPAADPADTPPLDRDVDAELEAALGTLRRLTEQGRR